MKQKDDSAKRATLGKLSGLVGIVCNVCLAGSKLAVGKLAGSMSITADGLNNLSDAASSIVTLTGFKLADKPADKEHPVRTCQIRVSGMSYGGSDDLIYRI